VDEQRLVAPSAVPATLSAEALARIRLIERYQYGLGAAALLVATLGVLYSTGALADLSGFERLDPADLAPEPAAFLAVVVLAAAGLLLQIRVTTDRGSVGFGWGEVALIAACYLLPAGFIPAAFLIGMLAGSLIRARLRGRLSFANDIGNTGTLALAAAAGATVTGFAGVRPYTGVESAHVAAIAAGAALYCTIPLVVVCAVVAARPPGQPYLPLVRTMGRSKAPMAVGNIGVGLAGLVAVTNSHWWLIAVPPAVWLLHQTYAYRLRSEGERRAWQAFAETTRELNHVDETMAASAGLQGAKRLFGIEAAEIVIDGPPGGPRSYVLSGGSVTRTEPPDPSGARPIATRALLVGGARIGELRLLSGPSLTRRDTMMLNAYGDALAASLHDAATNTELRTLAERSTYDAEHDGLTGLPNRGALLNRGASMLRALDPAAPVAVLLLDINHFKEVNTTLGHAAGDELLRIAAHRLTDGLAPGELLARLGGDEFALLLTSGTALLPYALARARHLAETLAVPTEVAGVQLSVEASIGVVAASAGAVDMTELLRRADIAMYQAKRDGSSVSWYDPARDDASTDRLALLAELREALAGKDQIYLLLQPAIALDTGQPVSVEAFVRWRHPRRGTLKPIHFVRAVEQSEMLAPFTRHVLELALEVAGQLRSYGMDLKVSVNLSPRSLHDRELPADLAHLLERFEVPADRVILDIMETVVLSKLPVVDDVLEALRRLGVELAVDDFGTGCSALTFITRVPVNEVKIDRTFVTRMVDSPEAAAIVRTTVELGRELDLRVVAEGVETAEQRRALVALGCQIAQGFHFYAPMPVPQMVEVLREVAAKPSAAVRHLRAAAE
jgi:diguanylate cyclase